MSKTAAQVKASAPQAATRSSATLLKRQGTLGPHVCVQREAVGHGVHPGASSLVRNVLNSPGDPVDAHARSLMEPRLGQDFSGVRVHTGGQAAESARAVRANAYTSGNHVVFGEGKYQPRSSEGQRILAHELTHVVQQSSGPVAGTEFAPGYFVSYPADPFEREAGKQSPAGAAARRVTQPGLQVPPAKAGSGSTYLQRDFLGLSSDALAGIGAAAGIASLGLAAFAYLRPPEALNPAPVTGGVSINPNPFSFNTVQQTPAMPQVTPVHEPPSQRAAFMQAQRGAPAIHPVLDVRTDNDNHVVFNVAERHDGLNIVDASIRTGTTQNYLGGSRGSSAMVNFSAFQTPPAGAGGIFDAPEAAGSTPAAAAATPAAAEPAEVTVSYTGTNAKDQGAPQNFAGSFRVKADGSVDVADPEITNGVGRADKAANVAFIDYRGISGGGSSSSDSPIVTPGSGDRDSPLDPERYLPINRPIAG